MHIKAIAALTQFCDFFWTRKLFLFFNNHNSFAFTNILQIIQSQPFLDKKYFFCNHFCNNFMPLIVNNGQNKKLFVCNNLFNNCIFFVLWHSVRNFQKWNWFVYTNIYFVMYVMEILWSNFNHIFSEQEIYLFTNLFKNNEPYSVPIKLQIFS